MKKAIVVGITGASGVIYGIRFLEILQQYPDLESHLILSKAAEKNISLETEYAVEKVKELADQVHDPFNLAAGPASGSFITEAMVVIPCTIKTLSGIAFSNNENLIIRAADVTLKENRKLILVPRETPLHKGHLQLLLQCADIGCTIIPPIPAFYHRPQSIADIIDHTLGKILDQLKIKHDLFKRWK